MIATDRCLDVRNACQDIFKKSLDWVEFYREVFGHSGVVRQMFPSPEQLAHFKESETYTEIQRMLSELRRKGPLRPHHEEPTEVITVRVPRCVHDALATEACEHNTTLNRLCISKLLQHIDTQLVPRTDLAEKMQRKGR